MSIICFILSALSIVGGILPADSIRARMDFQTWAYPQEEIYLSIDKRQYLSGDTVRLELELLEESSHTPSELSKYVYVELLNPFDEVVQRVKLIRHDDKINGYIPLSETLPEGEYVLIAYTRYMENLPSVFFASKRLQIISPQRGKRFITYSCNQTDGDLGITVNSFSPMTNEAVPSIIRVTTKSGKNHSKSKKSTSFSCKISKEDWKAGVVLLESDNFRTYLPIPYEPGSINIQIYPEGGHFLHNNINTAAIRITDSSGRGIKIDAEIVSKDKSIAIPVSTNVNGFGLFKMYAEQEEEYNVVIGSDTIPIKLKINNEPTLRVNSMKEGLISIQPTGTIADSTVLLIHNRGKLAYYSYVDGNNTILFDTQLIRPGIYEMILLSKDMRPFAERQVFVANQNLDERSFALNFVNELGEYIGETDSLMITTNRKIRYLIDNIMLATERWNRYDITKVINGIFTEPSLPVEIGGEISGIVKSRWKKSVIEDAIVDVVAPSIDYFTSVRTDKEGHFVINGIDWPDGTKFAIKVTNKRGDIEDNFEFNEEKYPKVHVIPPYYIKKNEDIKLSYDITDRLSLWLDEIEVKGKSIRETDDDFASIYEMLGAKKLTSEIIESKSITTYEEAIRLFAGVRITNGKVTYAGASGSLSGNDNAVEFYVDGTKWTSTFQSITDEGDSRFASGAMATAVERTAITMTGGLVPKDLAIQQHNSQNSDLAEFSSTFPFHNIKTIYFLRPSAAIFLSGSASRAGGALLFITKNGVDKKAFDDNLHIKLISPLGYQTPHPL